jgi:hypothetical protein
LVRSTIQAVTQPIRRATKALAAANTSEFTLVEMMWRPRSTVSKLSRPHLVALGVGPATLKLPWIRNRNGGTTRAHSTMMSSAASQTG